MKFHEWFYSAEHRQKYDTDHPAYLAAEEAWIAGRVHLSVDRMEDEKRQERLKAKNETP